VVDALGNPIYVSLSAGQVNDCVVATEVLSHLPLNGTLVMADKAYGTKAVREFISQQQAEYCIPPKANIQDPWPCDWWQYKERHLVECFFQKLKLFRRIATRYDKLARRFLAFVHLACIFICLK
jgi:transposase